MLPLHTIDKSWTLFLDRDGVINHEKNKDYIHTWDEFIFYEGALEAFKIFKQNFNRIIIVTNQRGVGKGVTRAEDVEIIHDKLKTAVLKEGGFIDAIYFCSALVDSHPDRKPQPGMGLKAIRQFPDIQISKSIIVGNNYSDMEFGRNLGMHTIFLSTTNKDVDPADSRIDAVFDSLLGFALAVNADKL